MGNHGYAMLPTAEKPTSNMTFRLSREEMDERNDWMLKAFERGMSYQEIAHEVGLSVIRVQQIIAPSPSQQPGYVPKKAARKEKKSLRKPETPRDAAKADFWANRAHRSCSNTYDGCCNDCFGMSMIIESEYDANGWPYDWAMYGQEEYIIAAGGDITRGGTPTKVPSIMNPESDW